MFDFGNISKSWSLFRKMSAVDPSPVSLVSKDEVFSSLPPVINVTTPSSFDAEKSILSVASAASTSVTGDAEKPEICVTGVTGDEIKLFLNSEPMDESG